MPPRAQAQSERALRAERRANSLPPPGGRRPPPPGPSGQDPASGSVGGAGNPLPHLPEVPNLPGQVPAQADQPQDPTGGPRPSAQVPGAITETQLENRLTGFMEEMRDMMFNAVSEMVYSRSEGTGERVGRRPEGVRSDDFVSAESPAASSRRSVDREIPFGQTQYDHPRVVPVVTTQSQPPPVQEWGGARLSHGMPGDMPGGGNQVVTERRVSPSTEGQVQSLFLEKVRKECHKLAKKDEKFTGKTGKGPTIITLRREIEETVEDHGWELFPPATYYLIRYSCTRSVWDDVLDVLGRDFDRKTLEGYRSRVASIWRVLEGYYSNAVVRDRLKSDWAKLVRRSGETCRDFLTRVRDVRKDLTYAGAATEDADELSVWRRGLFPPYSDWVGQYMSTFVSIDPMQSMPPPSIYALRAQMQLRGDEYEDRHGVAPVERSPSETEIVGRAEKPTEAGFLYAAVQGAKEGSPGPTQGNVRFKRDFPPPHECLKHKCQRCYSEQHAAAQCLAAQPADLTKRCRRCGLTHNIQGWNPTVLRCPNPRIAEERCWRCNGKGHMARICMKTLDQKTESEKKPSDNIEPQKEAGSEKQAQNTAISLPSSNTGSIRCIRLYCKNKDDPDSPALILDAMLDSGCSESFCSLETDERLREKNLVTSMSTDGAGTPVQFGNASFNKLLGRAVSHHCRLEDNTPLSIEWGVLQTLSPYPALISLKTLRPKGAIWVISPAGDRLILGDPGDFLPVSNAVYTPFHGLRGLVMNGITTVPSALAGQMAGIRDPSEVSPLEENPTDSVDENDVSVERDTLQLSSSTPPRVWIGDADETAPRGRLWVDIPWRSNERPPRSFAQAWHRDKSLRKRLTLAPEKLSMFQQQADLLVSEGYAEPIDSDLPRYPPSEIDAIDKHYISIVPVFSAARSTRCRLCLDARVANKYTRPGWHDPKALLKALVGWRLYVWIGLFDISKAFWRIYIPTDQRSWLCCVVCSRRLRFRSLPFGLNFSPCALLEGTTLIKNALIELLKDTSGITPKEDAQEESAAKYDHQDVDHTTPEPPRPKKIKCEMYVDDGQVRENQNPNHGRRQLHWVRWGFGQHGFPSMGSKTGGNFDIPESVIVAEWEPGRIRETSQHLQNVSPDSSQWIPFLGYKWDPITDVVVQFFPLLEPTEQAALETQTNVTRRMVISVAQRWHDPLGLFLTEGSFARWIASKAIHSTQEWEQAVSPEIAKELHQWVSYMQSSLHVAPRYCSPKEIFIFSDASITGWSVEIRDHSMRLLYARSGIFPPECRYTIPRKETEAAVRAAETLDKYLTALPEDDDMPSPLIKGLHTDSEILIHRLRGGDRMLKGLSAVERRRIGKIADAVKNHKTICCHIPGSINPSDGASRADQYGPPKCDLVSLRSWLGDEALKETSLKWDSAIARELNELPIDSYLCDPNDRTVSLMNPLHSRLTRLECLPAAIADIKAYQDQDRWCSRLKELIGRNDAPKWTKEFEIDPAGLIRRRSPVSVIESKAQEVNPLLIPCNAETLNLRHELTQDAHIAFAHAGGVRTMSIVKRSYFWKRMNKTCSQVVKECEQCQRVRASNTWRRAAGVVKFRGNALPGEAVGIDVMYLPPQEQNGTRFVGIITVTCVATKWLRVVPITSMSGKEAAESLDRLFYNGVFPRIIIMDRGSNFIDVSSFRFWAAKRQVHLRYFPVASSSLAGWIERPHKGLRDFLRPMLLDHSDPSLIGENTWVNRLPRAVYCWNISPYYENCPYGLCPYSMVFGANPRVPGIESNSEVSDEELEELGFRHLTEIPSWQAQLAEMARSRENLRDITLKEYVAIWASLREKVRGKLLRRTGKTEEIHDGDFVRRVRPKMPASEPMIVLKTQGSVIRIIDSFKKLSDEYVGNLVLCKSEPFNKADLLVAKAAYESVADAYDLPAVLLNRKLQQLPSNEASSDADGSVTAQSDLLTSLPRCTPENMTPDATLVVILNCDGNPTVSYWRNKGSGDGSCDLWELEEVDDSGDLINERGRVLSVTRNNGFFDSLPTVCAYKLRLPLTRQSKKKLDDIIRWLREHHPQ